jgi:hypothetical protein
VQGNRIRGREMVGLELSGCCVVSTCCSNVGEKVVSEGVAFSGCDMVEKACCAGSSCRSKGHVYLELLGKEIVVARFLMITVKFCIAEMALRERRRWLRPSIKHTSVSPRIDLCPLSVVK